MGERGGNTTVTLILAPALALLLTLPHLGVVPRGLV